MTVKEAAAELGVSPALVYALCAAGRIEHERYGLGRGTIRISPDAIRAFREDSKMPGKAPRGVHQGAPFRELNASKLVKAWRKRTATAESDA